MRSTIKIEINFEEGNLPVIEVINISSDDVRDKLISVFLQSLSHTSRWCKIIYMGNCSRDANEPRNRWQIIPVKPEEIEQEISLMQGVLERWKGIENQPADPVN